MGTINHHHNDDFIIQNGKNEILEKSDASNIADKWAFQNAGIYKCGHLVTNASLFYMHVILLTSKIQLDHNNIMSYFF